MTPQERVKNKTLTALIIEITLRATSKVCIGFSAARINTVALPLCEGLAEMVIMQGNGLEESAAVHYIEAPDYHCFELWNRIIDEIEKEIPVASKIEVLAKVTRSQRQNFNSGQWATGTMTRREIADLHMERDNQ